MVGLCGTYGSKEPSLDPMADRLDRRRGLTVSSTRDRLHAAGATHHPTPQSVAVEGVDATVLVTGEVYSRERTGGYDRRPAGVSTSNYCARAYAEDGIEALTQLNGEFVCLVVDEDGRRPSRASSSSRPPRSRRSSPRGARCRASATGSRPIGPRATPSRRSSTCSSTDSRRPSTIGSARTAATGCCSLAGATRGSFWRRPSWPTHTRSMTDPPTSRRQRGS